jgi:hypothetical protein
MIHFISSCDVLVHRSWLHLLFIVALVHRHQVITLWHLSPRFNRLIRILIQTSCNFFFGSPSPKTPKLSMLDPERWVTGREVLPECAWVRIKCAWKTCVGLWGYSWGHRELPGVGGPGLGEAGHYILKHPLASDLPFTLATGLSSQVLPWSSPSSHMTPCHVSNAKSFFIT